MGTRAMITIDMKPFIATHWDGYPDELGLGSTIMKRNPTTKNEIIEVAKEHQIDFAQKEIQKLLNKERIKEIAERHNLTKDQVKQGLRRGHVISSNDFEISEIENYSDFAEYQYDFDTKTKTWRVAELSYGWKGPANEKDFMSIPNMIEKIKKESES